MKTNIICRLQVEGLHWWADASRCIIELIIIKGI